MAIWRGTSTGEPAFGRADRLRPRPVDERPPRARRHGGTWNLFFQRFVTTGAFDQSLHSLAQQAQKAREGADYEARTPPADEAKTYVDGAAEFVAAVEHMLA